MPPATQRSCTAEARGYRVDLKDAPPRRPATRRLKDELKLLRGRAKYALQPRPRSLKIFVLGTGRSGTHWLRSEEHTSELQSLMRISYAVFCLKKKIQTTTNKSYESH